MTATRRLGASDSDTRARLLDAAEQLMLREGYAAVSSRRVAAEAGIKPQLVHYYFRTMDDLFLETYRRRATAPTTARPSVTRSRTTRNDSVTCSSRSSPPSSTTTASLPTPAHPSSYWWQ